MASISMSADTTLCFFMIRRIGNPTTCSQVCHGFSPRERARLRMDRRPNLPDEGDNHLIELALAGGAQAIVTHNLRDLRGGELQLGTLRVMTPAQCLEEWR